MCLNFSIHQKSSNFPTSKYGMEISFAMSLPCWLRYALALQVFLVQEDAQALNVYQFVSKPTGFVFKLTPLTWSTDIALKVDIIGCTSERKIVKPQEQLQH